jgi:hypothetical protein
MQRTEAVEGHGPGERIAGLAVVQPGIATAAHVTALESVEGEGHWLDPSTSQSATGSPSGALRSRMT